MSDRTITYRKLRILKYQLREDVNITIDLTPKDAVETPFITLSKEGALWIKSGYSWDGPSGPTIDTNNFMRGSLVHDALYQLMRESKLDYKRDRDQADKVLCTICKEDGMSSFRAKYVYLGLKYKGQKNAMPTPNTTPKLFTVPKLRK